MPNFIIKADFTKAHKHSLGFEYDTKIVRGRFTFGNKTKVPMFIDKHSTEQQPKVFTTEASAQRFIDSLKKYSKTDKHITIIDYSISYEGKI
jgi:D-alanine-D-alanine ligase-like ATP-grasp enzyme|tara:strand:+ start:2843 stop:3118 length:276 start_codon:yes stop_codon:yes gene_type:complete